MKKIKIWGSLLLSMLLLVACDADRDNNPVINTNSTPASFKLNTPTQADQNVDLEGNSVFLTWETPDYGYNTIATYKIQVGVVQADGSIKWNTKKTKDKSGNVVDTGEPEFALGSFNTPKAEISGKWIAMEINQIDGLEKIDDYTDLGYRKIAMRIHAAININSTEEVKGTSVFSDAIYYQKMRSYKVIKLPAPLYLVGTPNEWLAPEAKNEEALQEWALFETEIGNNVFEGTLELPAAPQFRFYATLDGWGDAEEGKTAGSYGPQLKDEGVAAAFDAAGNFPNTEFEDGSLMPGKGSWKFTSFEGGKVNMIVDMNAMTVKFTVVSDEE